jgi:hypothetical protein
MTDIRGWHGHLLFAFWVMDVLKPGIFVELGTHRGDSYCAFCQAVRELSLETRCWAVDTWKGDAQAGYYDETIFKDLAGYHQKKYSDFSNLIRKTFDDALPLFEDASIDLLHIDGHHTYEDAEHDFFSWLPKISGNGIVLMHDTQVHGQGFGVWKLFGELSEKYPSFEFTHSNGLGILGVGNTQPPGIKRLFAMSRFEAEEVRAYFRNLGTKLNRQESEGLEAARDEIEKLRDKLKESTATALELQESVRDLKARLTAVNSELDEAKRQNGAFEMMIDQRDRSLNEILSSRGWRWLTRFRRAKQMLGIRRLAKKQNNPGDPS